MIQLSSILLEKGEESGDLRKLSSETILIRWLNFHLKEAQLERRIRNLEEDISDSTALFYILK